MIKQLTKLMKTLMFLFVTVHGRAKVDDKTQTVISQEHAQIVDVTSNICRRCVGLAVVPAFFVASSPEHSQHYITMEEKQ